MENAETNLSEKMPSNSHQPDLDWSQIRETVLLLNLSVAHIKNSMSEGDESINTLTDTVTAMISSVKTIGEVASDLPESEAKSTILRHHQDVDSKIHEIVISFQFYDKLVQRLSHASNCLSDLGSLVSEQSRLYNPLEWKKLQNFIESKYTVEADKIMFQALKDGATVEEAVRSAKQQQKHTSKSSETIELF